MDNKSLYWYGFKANMRKTFGAALCFLGFFLFILFIGLGHGFLAIFLAIACVGYGIYTSMKAEAQRFDYQRQSGSIIHQGDGWGR